MQPLLGTPGHDAHSLLFDHAARLEDSLHPVKLLAAAAITGALAAGLTNLSRFPRPLRLHA